MSKANYDLWDVEAGNLVGTFDTEGEALGLVRDLLDANGSDYADALDLGCVDEQGAFRTIATGAALAATARTAVPEGHPITAS